jgi:hypothetical protein
MGEITLTIGGSIFRPPDKPEIDQAIVPFAPADTKEWEWNNVAYDPINHTLMLRPLQLSESYNTQTTGILSRLRKANWTLTDADWEEVEHGFSENWFLLSKNGTTEGVTTTTSWTANRGFYLRFMVFPTATVQDQIVRVIFGQYTLDIWRDGWTQLSLTSGMVFKDQAYIVGGYDRNYQHAQDMANGQMVNLIILPYRRNQIAFWSSLNGGWAYTDPTLSTDTLGTITDAGPVSLQFPSSKAFFQLMPLTYPATGTVGIMKALPFVPDGTGVSVVSHDSPSDSQFTAEVDSITATGSLVEVNHTLTFASDNTGVITPMLYGLRWRWPSSGDNVSADSTQILKWKAESMRVSIPTERDARTLDWVVEDEQYISLLDGKSNRSVLLKDGDDEIFLGLTEMPELFDPLAPELHCHARDLWKRFEHARFRTTWSADGMDHTDVIKKCAKLAGLPDDRLFLYVEDPAYTMPVGGRGDKQAWEFEAGKTAAEVMNAIADHTGWVLNVQPENGKIKLLYAPMESFSTEPVKTLYPSRENGLRDISDTYWREGFRQAYIEPEATHIRFIGLSEDEELIVAEYTDVDAENPDLQEFERPENWVGERRYCAEQNYSWMTQEAVNHALDIAVNRKKYTSRRKLVEFTSEFDNAIWPGYVVRLVGIGDVRIWSYEAGHDYLNSLSYYQPTNYMGEVIATDA